MLHEAGHSIDRVSSPLDLLIFESATVVGFVFAYENAGELLRRWNTDMIRVISEYQLGLRRAQAKAWNTYAVFLAVDDPTFTERVALSSIEEDLTIARKIARAGVREGAGARNALLSLLPIQHAPRLEPVDMVAEVSLRAGGVPPKSLEAFLSGAPDTSIVQVLEEDA